MRLAVVLGALAIAAACGACSAPCDGPTCIPTADAGVGSSWDLEHTFNLRRDGLAEAQLDMPAGSRVEVELTVTPHAIEWDIHSHDADGTPTTHTGGRQAEASYDFVAPSSGTYFALWSNTAGTQEVTIAVKLRFFDGAAFVRWR